MFYVKTACLFQFSPKTFSRQIISLENSFGGTETGKQFLYKTLLATNEVYVDLSVFFFIFYQIFLHKAFYNPEYKKLFVEFHLLQKHNYISLFPPIYFQLHSKGKLLIQEINMLHHIKRSKKFLINSFTMFSNEKPNF